MMSSLDNAAWLAAARTRLSRNPAMMAIVDKLLEVKKLSGKDRSAAVKELATGESLAMGENNFYNLADITKYQVDIRVEMHGA